MTKNERYVPDDQGFVYDTEKMCYVSDIFELLNKLNDECKKLNLMLCYNITESAVYEGFFRGEQNLVGFTDRKKTITIKEPVPDWDCSKICYTLERIM